MIAVIDYALGNLKSVCRALAEVSGGLEVRLADSAHALEQASHIVLPGVGNFRQGMGTLSERGIDEALRRLVLEKQVPFLGICLGMQLLANHGEESGPMGGLGLLPGRTRLLKTGGLPLPHIGWNSIELTGAGCMAPPDFSGKDFYFVHSYIYEGPAEVVSAWCTYGERFPAMLEKDNILATQFHPEKSRRLGLELLRSFVQGKACLKPDWFLSCS